MSPILLRAAAALAAITISACGHVPATELRTGDDNSSPGHPAPSAEHNAADVTFATNMIPHHQQAVDMAALVPSRTANPDVRVMANHISSDQQAEIRTMTGLLAQWGEQAAASHRDQDGMGMAGMVDSGTLAQIRSQSGPPFDTRWLTAMIGHHEGAIAMARTEIAHGESAEAVKLATMIISAQRREIAQMNNLLNVTQ